MALSGLTAPPPLRIGNDMGIAQCIRHIVRYEGPMALFKGKHNISTVKLIHKTDLPNKRGTLSCAKIFSYFGKLYFFTTLTLTLRQGFKIMFL